MSEFNPLDEGLTSISEMLTPSSIIFSSESELKIENNYGRGFSLGYPSSVIMGWLNDLYSYPGDMDIAMFINPKEAREALDALTNKISQFQAQLITELEKGSIKNTTDLQNKIDKLMKTRVEIEQGYVRMFLITSLFELYNKDKKELGKETQAINAKLGGADDGGFTQLDLLQDEAYMSCSPFGLLSITGHGRNIDTYALSTMFPFYNSSINEPNGTYIGRSLHNDEDVFIDLFNMKKNGNANVFISGKSGAGKSFFTSLLIMRDSLNGIRHCIIDPENEFGECTDILGGISIEIAPNSATMLNCFDIDEEVETDSNDRPTGRKFVDIKGKATELLNLFGVMFGQFFDAEIRAEVSDVLINMYYTFGFTEDVESLYDPNANNFNPVTGEYSKERVYKVMPTMSDFKRFLLYRYEQTNNSRLYSCCSILNMYTKGGSCDFFDCYTTIPQAAFKSAPVIRFNVKGLEESTLRPIGMQVALSWTWNKFMKKDARTKKRIVCDEAWMLLQRSFAGSDYTALFLENCARRVRKYNGSLCCASQNFREFVGRTEGQSILTNSAVKMFLKQDEVDIKEVSDKFILSDGEKSFVLTAKKGEVLVKIRSESLALRVIAFPFEEELIKKDYLDDDEF